MLNNLHIHRTNSSKGRAQLNDEPNRTQIDAEIHQPFPENTCLILEGLLKIGKPKHQMVK